MTRWGKSEPPPPGSWVNSQRRMTDEGMFCLARLLSGLGAEGEGGHTTWGREGDIREQVKDTHKRQRCGFQVAAVGKVDERAESSKSGVWFIEMMITSHSPRCGGSGGSLTRHHRRYINFLLPRSRHWGCWSTYPLIAKKLAVFPFSWTMVCCPGLSLGGAHHHSPPEKAAGSTCSESRVQIWDECGDSMLLPSFIK